MKITENEALADELIDYLRDLLRGKVTLPAVDYKRDLQYYHRSELLGCLMVPFLARTVPPDDVQPLSRERVLYFARGRAVERIFGADNKPLVRDGIIVSVDKISSLYGLTEMKSTVMSSASFPDAFDKNRQDWANECKAVAAAYEDTSCNIAIMFLEGNRKKWGNPDRVDVDMKAWRLEFETSELWGEWSEMRGRKAVLDDALALGIAPPLDVVKPTITSWGCAKCEYNNLCPYFQCLTWGPQVTEKKEDTND